MIDIVLYTFSKIENSTKQPTDGTSLNCRIKEGCSIINPRLIFNLESPQTYNYAYISIFDRYYYINDWTYVEGLWECNLTCDVLATYRNDIRNSNLYVLRSSSDSNGNILDNMYPCTGDLKIKKSEFPSIWETEINNGFYVVGIINSEVEGVGATTYYSLNRVQMKTLNNYLMGTTNLLDMTSTEFSEAIQKILFNPYQYIVSCNWFPFPPLEDNLSLLKYGWWDVPSSGAIMHDFIYSTNFDMSIPKHDQIGTRGAYLQSEPFSNYYLCFYPFGVIKLSSSELYGATTLRLRVTVDLITGVGRLIVAVGDNVISNTMAQVGIPIQLSQVTTDYLAMAQSIIGGSGTIASGFMNGGPAGGIVGTFSAIGDIARSIAPKVSSSGSGGGFSSLRQAFNSNQIELYGLFYPVVDEDNEHRGRPLCEKVLLSTLSGYILVSDGDISISGTLEENRNIKSYLESGLYLE